MRPLAGHAQAAVFDADTGSLAVLSPGPAGQSVITSAAPRAATTRSVPLPGTGDRDDRATTRAGCIVSTRGGYFRVDLAAGTATLVGVDGQNETDFTAIARRADGRLVLGSADGTVFTLSSDTAVGAQLKIFARVDALVTQGNTAVVLDRGQTSVTALYEDGTEADHALRAGEGATTMAADAAGRVLVADTRGGQLLVFGIGSADPSPGVSGARRTVRTGRIVDAGLGVADCVELRGWLRFVNRHPRREGALSNRAAAELPGLRRIVWHPVCGVGLGSGCPGDPRRGGGFVTAMQRGRMPEGWADVIAADLSDDYEWIPLRLPPDLTRISASTRLSIEAEYRGWELTRVRLYTDGSRRVLLRRKKSAIGGAGYSGAARPVSS